MRDWTPGLVAVEQGEEEEDKLKGLTPKEREEFKRALTRLSGAQLTSLKSHSTLNALCHNQADSSLNVTKIWMPKTKP